MSEPVDPLVSVLTPSFNQARWLDDTIRSVAAQTYPHIEHVIVDGGSTDGSIEVLRNAPAGVRWISEPDGGQSEAINKAFRLSRGSIIGWLNSDDAYFSRDAVRRAVDAFARHPEASIAYGHSVLADATGRVMHVNWVPRPSRRVLAIHNFIIQPAAFVRRSSVGENLVDDAFGYAMDRELWLRLMRDHPAVRVSIPLAIDRHHDARKSYTRRDLFEQDQEELIRRYGVPRDTTVKGRLKLLKVGLRWAGLFLALRLPSETDPACDITIPSRAVLCRNQVLVPRRRIADPG